MAGPTIYELYQYMTVSQAAERLGINPSKLRRRLRDGIFPPPTFINKHGVKFFDEEWLRATKAIFGKSFEGQTKAND